MTAPIPASPTPTELPFTAADLDRHKLFAKILREVGKAETAPIPLDEYDRLIDALETARGALRELLGGILGHSGDDPDCVTCKAMATARAHLGQALNTTPKVQA